MGKKNNQQKQKQSQQQQLQQQQTNTDLLELQRNEIEALKAIFLDEFQDVSVQDNVWKRSTLLTVENQETPCKNEFKLYLRPHGEELKSFVGVYLKVRLPKQYPNQPPILLLSKDKGLSDAQIDELQTLINAKVKELVGQEMIFEIASMIEEWISQHNAAIRGVKQISFYEQMLDRREKDEKLEQQKALEELHALQKQEEEARREENEQLMGMIQGEIKKKEEMIKLQKQRLKELRKTSPENSVNDRGDADTVGDGGDDEEVDNEEGMQNDDVDEHGAIDENLNLINDAEATAIFAGTKPTTRSPIRAEFPPPLLQAQSHMPNYDNTFSAINPNPDVAAIDHGVGGTLQRNASASQFGGGFFPPFSRYRADFEELSFLGKGGFGEVVKARNKIDGRYYAIKKIKMDPEDVENSKRILREVQLLSRLHHQFVVRYYQSWFEDASGVPFEAASSEEETEDNPVMSSSEEEDSDSDSSSNDDSSSDTTSSSDDDDDLQHGINFKPHDFDFLSKELTESMTNSYIQFAHEDGAGDADEGDSSNESSDEMTNTTSDAARKSRRRERRNTESTEGLQTLQRKRKSREPNAIERYRILYISMEYCQRTLRDLINEGLNEEESWRLFRQILEGLAHIHSQGMIHRDLKPSNIFLDASGNVKIGDFGLATAAAAATSSSKVETVHNAMGSSNISSTTPRMSSLYSHNSEDPSLTSAIGTPLYASPEIIDRNAKYTTKVDMYSLGICFFEMLSPPFQTAMERIQVIKDLRSKAILFPSDFEQKYPNQIQIIRMLLNHTPKERPSAMELMKSKLLPARLEEEYLQEAFRLVINQNNALYYSRLMDALFAQTSNKHIDYVYDFNSGSMSFDQITASIIGKVQAVVMGVFQKHGAVEVNVPLLMPKTTLYDTAKNPVELLDTSGYIVQLPFDLTLPFARYISRVQHNFKVLKRFCFDRVFRKNQVGGQPRSVMEVDFDIVHTTPSATFAPEAEVLKTVMEVINEFPACQSNGYYIRLNHTRILECILDHCKFPNDTPTRRTIQHVLEQLDKPLTWAQFRVQLAQQLKVSRSVVDRLEPFYLPPGDINSVMSKLEPLFKDAHESVQRVVKESGEKLKVLVSQLRILGVSNKIVLVPLLSYNSHYYKGGIVFQVAGGSKRKLDVVAAGGRYDHLISSFQHPSLSSSKRLLAVGVNIALQKIIHHVAVEQTEQLRQWAARKNDSSENWSLNHFGRRCDVYIVSYGRVSVAERLGIAAELWAANISADVMFDETYHPDELMTLARVQGYPWIIVVKQKSVNDKLTTIKIKNMITRTETEVARRDVIAHLQTEMVEYLDYNESSSQARQHPKLRSQVSHEVMKDDHHHHHQKTESSSDYTVTVLQAPSKNKMKHKQKQLIIDKALASMSSLLGDKQSIQVLALELNKESLRKLGAVDVLDDDAFRRFLDEEKSAPQQRDYLLNIRKHMVQVHKDNKQKWIWLYSFREDSSHVYQYITNR